MSTTRIDLAKQLWQNLSKKHVAALANVRIAQEALERLQGLIADQAVKLTAAETKQRAGILAAFGLGGKAEEPAQNVADIRAHLDAFESVLTEHQQALHQAQEHAKQTDADVKDAERAILKAKASKAHDEEQQAFEAFKAAHLRHLAANTAAQGAVSGIRHDWSKLLYGDRVQIDGFVPTVPEMAQILIHQAEKGE
ncbi:hypothetical protein [Comamonas sp.]|uniref:hypothetical protein n=1 Tax=Comamonas sp. TaxID=34028 RepID=UPI0012C3376F|nr:hypothetical protein [Comamonas sp.]MPS96185.1 hypothetical protein [Comamonas sp.]